MHPLKAWLLWASVLVLARLADSQSLDLKLLRHQGCALKKSALWTRKIEFEGGQGSKGAQLITLPQNNCYSIQKGEYDDVELRFCLPNIKKIMEWQGISEAALDRILATTGMDSSGAPKLSLFVTVYVFDKNITPLLLSQRRLEAKIREQKRVPDEEQLESKLFWNLPFNQMIRKQAGFIACHKLYGTITLKN